MAGYAAPCSLLDSRLLVQGWAAIFFYCCCCFGIASRIMCAAFCGVLEVASTSLANVSRNTASSACVMLSCSIPFYLLPGRFSEVSLAVIVLYYIYLVLSSVFINFIIIFTENKTVHYIKSFCTYKRGTGGGNMGFLL